MKKKFILEMSFLVILITLFMLPSFSKMPFGILEEDGCDCDDCQDDICTVLEWLIFGDVEEMDVFVKIPLIMQNQICNVKSKFYLKDKSNNILIDEFTQYGPGELDKTHSYQNQLWVRSIEFERSIDADELKDIDMNDPNRVKMTFYACMLDQYCPPDLERRIVPMSVKTEKPEVSQGRAKMVVTFDGPWNYLDCFDCCPN